MSPREVKFFFAWLIGITTFVAGVMVGLWLIGTKDELAAVLVVVAFVLAMVAYSFAPDGRPTDRR